MLSRNLFSQLRRVNFFNNPARRFFAFKYQSFKEILKSEVNHEETNYTPVDKTELNQFFNSTKFQFIESETSTKMELKKIDGNNEVIVNFYAKPPTPQTEQDPNNQEEAAPENLNDFSIRITKPGQTSGLLVYATLIDNHIEYNSIIYSDNVHELIEKESQTESYLGPEFSTLEETLQDEFTEYFASLGINGELASFIQVLAVDKDQRLYLKWLKDVNNFI